ncbi:MAG: hypothetical protein KatS3mg091_073 [Patescibacteria group bacterium]|nr:MAG: hypothetical protein KatS3mg091_073 [Patescibacteria group bacterium]
MSIKLKKYPETLIIPVYNEERTIEFVLKQLISFDLFSEIIVVDDGSLDNSLSILKRYSDKIKIIELKKNFGKAYAVCRAVESASFDYIVFCDADLTSFTRKHFESLIAPLNYDLADQVLAIRESDYNIFAKLTGERAYRKKDLVKHIKKVEHSRFSLEVYLNSVFKTKRTYLFYYPGLKQLGKSNSWIGKILLFDEYVKEADEILKEIAKLNYKSRDINLMKKLKDNINKFIGKLKNIKA